MYYDEIHLPRRIDIKGFQKLPGSLQFIQHKNVVPEEGIFSFAIQEPPHVRTILCDDQKYRCSFPWCVFFPAIRIDECEFEEEGNIIYCFYSFAVGFSNAKIGKSSKRKLYYAHLPNVQDYSVCMGEDGDCLESKCAADLCVQSINHFWNSCFQTSEGGNMLGNEYCSDEVDSKVRTFEDWEKNTIKNPNFATKVKWYKDARSKTTPEMMVYI